MPTKAAVRSEQAPAPFAGAPYSQAIRVGDLVFVSGQIPLKPGSTVQVAATPPARSLRSRLSPTFE
jgi:enamine deaminase RidA (YjgF/YER057c/UK114 family)